LIAGIGMTAAVADATADADGLVLRAPGNMLKTAAPRTIGGSTSAQALMPICAHVLRRTCCDRLLPTIHELHA
jgi:hypothetical protein